MIIGISWHTNQRSNGTPFHSNHHKVSSYHLCTHLKSIDDTIRIKVKELIENGLRNNMIVNNLKSAHRVDINATQIQNIREDSINEVLNVDEKNYKSSVDRLLSLFNKMSDVSFVYMMHTITSGFVTFHKTKGECNAHKVNNQNDKDSYGSLTSEDTNCIETWRKKLKIGDEDKILVAFAWCHDDEKRKMLMFPEFWATDMTFGLNIERRQLLTVAGVDGNCKSFTGLRVWMPSKQRVAYQWALSTALPVLIYNEKNDGQTCRYRFRSVELREPVLSRNFIGSDEHFKRVIVYAHTTCPSCSSIDILHASNLFSKRMASYFGQVVYVVLLHPVHYSTNAT